MQSQNRFTNSVAFAFLVICLLAFFALRCQLGRPGSLPLADSDALYWVQPEALDTMFKGAIRIDQSQFDFSRLEPLLWQVRLDDGDGLLVTTELERLLAQMAHEIPPTAGADELERVTYLIAKSLPAEAGKKLGSLLQNYIAYHRLVQKSTTLNAGATTVSEDLRTAQRRFFGIADATALFEYKNRTLDYLNQRKIINLDSTLSDQQKRVRLDALQQEHRTFLKTTQGG